MSTKYAQTPLIGKLSLIGQITLQTGLHIGTGGENLDIGGLDKLVIRDPLTRHPYLPGSSIKGKLRSTLERLLNKPLNRDGGGGNDTWRYESDDLADGFTEVEEKRFIPYEGARTCQISRLFGSAGGSKCWMTIETARNEGLSFDESSLLTIDGQNHVKINHGRNAPSRLIIRDSHLQKPSADKLKQIDTGLYMTEWKFENGIDRVTAAANPRQVERIPAGSQFHFELIYTVEDVQQAVEDLQNIAIALAFLEDDALGGHGSRGYGKVRFDNFQFKYRSLEHYRQMTNESTGPSSVQTLEAIPNTQALLDNFRTLREYLQGVLPGGEV